MIFFHRYYQDQFTKELRLMQPEILAILREREADRQLLGLRRMMSENRRLANELDR
jgi:hypothetical protein